MGLPYNAKLLDHAVKAWDAEKTDYDYNTMKCKPGKVCGHYTQVYFIGFVLKTGAESIISNALSMAALALRSGWDPVLMHRTSQIRFRNPAM